MPLSEFKKTTFKFKYTLRGGPGKTIYQKKKFERECKKGVGFMLFVFRF